MAESIVQVTEGSGKKLHTNSYTVGANTVEDEVVVLGPHPYPTYILNAVNVSGATATDHMLCLNAGASLKVRVHRIRIEQRTNAGAVSLAGFGIVRTTAAAPTGGTALTPQAYDTADTAGATGRTIPGVKGTEAAANLMDIAMVARQAFLATASQPDDMWEWVQATYGKPIIIPAGTTNGLVIKNGTAIAGSTWNLQIEFSETAF